MPLLPNSCFDQDPIPSGQKVGDADFQNVQAFLAWLQSSVSPVVAPPPSPTAKTPGGWGYGLPIAYIFSLATSATDTGLSASFQPTSGDSPLGPAIPFSSLTVHQTVIILQESDDLTNVIADPNANYPPYPNINAGTFIALAGSGNNCHEFVPQGPWDQQNQGVVYCRYPINYTGTATYTTGGITTNVQVLVIYDFSSSLIGLAFKAYNIQMNNGKAAVKGHTHDGITSPNLSFWNTKIFTTQLGNTSLQTSGTQVGMAALCYLNDYQLEPRVARQVTIPNSLILVATGGQPWNILSLRLQGVVNTSIEITIKNSESLPTPSTAHYQPGFPSSDILFPNDGTDQIYLTINSTNLVVSEYLNDFYVWLIAYK